MTDIAPSAGGICCPKSIRGIAIRFTMVDICGKPVDTAVMYNSQVATESFVSLSLSPDIESGETFRKKLANGKICINDNEDCDRMVGMTVELMLCELPPHIMEMLLGSTMLQNGEGDIVGSVLADTNFDSAGETGCNRGVVLEIWSENSDKSICDTDGNAYPFIRWIVPRAFKWQLSSDLEFSNSDLEWSFSGYAEGNPGFASPVGANDPDLNAGMISAICKGGPLAWVCTNDFPDTVDCDYTNPSPSTLL